MKILYKICVITGAAGGIGAALTHRFALEGARGIVLADKQGDVLREVAKDVHGEVYIGDMTSEEEIIALIDKTEKTYGEIDVFCSNAGIIRLGSEQAPNDEWQLCWDLHVMAHVFAARHLGPKMAANGNGYLINASSAAGLLNRVNSATYTVTKHAAVAFAEWISINYGDSGVKVLVFCHQAVSTQMIEGYELAPAGTDGIISVEYLAKCVIDSIENEDFLILPHPKVKGYIRQKNDDIDRWLTGMRKFKAMHPNSI